MLKDIRQYFLHKDEWGRPRPETYSEAVERLGEKRVTAMYDALWTMADKLPQNKCIFPEDIVSDPANFGIIATIMTDIVTTSNTAREKEIKLLQKKYPDKIYGNLSWFYCHIPKYDMAANYSRLQKVIESCGEIMY